MRKLPGFSAAAALGGATQHYRAQHRQARTSVGAKPAVVLPDEPEAFGVLGNELPEETMEGVAVVDEEALEVSVDYGDDEVSISGETVAEEDEILITDLEENDGPTAYMEETGEIDLDGENGEFIQETMSQGEVEEL